MSPRHSPLSVMAHAPLVAAATTEVQTSQPGTPFPLTPSRERATRGAQQAPARPPCDRRDPDVAFAVRSILEGKVRKENQGLGQDGDVARHPTVMRLKNDLSAQFLTIRWRLPHRNVGVNKRAAGHPPI